MLVFEDLGDAYRIALAVTIERRQQGRERLHARILPRRLGPLTLTQHPPHGVARNVKRSADHAQGMALVLEQPDGLAQLRGNHDGAPAGARACCRRSN